MLPGSPYGALSEKADQMLSTNGDEQSRPARQHAVRRP